MGGLFLVTRVWTVNLLIKMVRHAVIAKKACSKTQSLESSPRRRRNKFKVGHVSNTTVESLTASSQPAIASQTGLHLCRMLVAHICRRLSLPSRFSTFSTVRSPKLSNMFSSVTGPSWCGWNAIKNLVVLWVLMIWCNFFASNRGLTSLISGDSYSSVGFELTKAIPTRYMPLGIEFPGITYTEDMKLPNWVGHLITMSQKENLYLIVHDYAIGGQTVSGVKNQATKRFIPHAGQKPDYFPWTEEDTLFGLYTWSYTLMLLFLSSSLQLLGSA